MQRSGCFEAQIEMQLRRDAEETRNILGVRRLGLKSEELSLSLAVNDHLLARPAQAVTMTSHQK